MNMTLSVIRYLLKFPRYLQFNDRWVHGKHQILDQNKEIASQTDLILSDFDQISHTDRISFVDWRAVVRFSISVLVFEIFVALWPLSACCAPKFRPKQTAFRSNRSQFFLQVPIEFHAIIGFYPYVHVPLSVYRYLL